MKYAREVDSVKISQFAKVEKELKARIGTLETENEDLSKKVKLLSPIMQPTIIVTKSVIQVVS